MIITQKKPIEELMALIGEAKTVAIVGCGSCATACHTGGEPEIKELAQTLEAAGKTVVATAYPDYCCMNLAVKVKMKPIVAAKPDCVICMSCGDGVQCVAKNVPGIPTYPSNNTMYLGEALHFGVWEEACHFCGQKNGKCEVNPENDCAWIKIYNRLEQIGQLEKFGQTREDKGYAKVSYPRTISLKGKK